MRKNATSNYNYNDRQRLPCPCFGQSHNREKGIKSFRTDDKQALSLIHRDANIAKTHVPDNPKWLYLITGRLLPQAGNALLVNSQRVQ